MYIYQEKAQLEMVKLQNICLKIQVCMLNIDLSNIWFIKGKTNIDRQYPIFLLFLFFIFELPGCH